MKFFLAIAAFVAVAAATPVAKSTPDFGQMEAIIAAIHNPTVDPAVAAILENHLDEMIAALSPVAVGPAEITDTLPETGVSLEPAWIEQPVHPVNPIQPSPVVVGAIPEGSPAPLVQIIVNVKQTPTTPNVPISLEPAWVESIPAEPVNIVEVNPEPVNVVEVNPEPIVFEPIQPVEPVIVGTPILPAPAAVLPDELN